MPKRSPRTTRHAPGPNSRADRLATRIDGRTTVGKIMSQVTAELTADLGGDPSTAEKLLISNVRVKVARLWLLEQQLLDGTVSEGDDVDPKHVLSWSNSLRLDLVALGLKRRARDVGVIGAPRNNLRERALAVVEATA